jgi:hypothetical protein
MSTKTALEGWELRVSFLIVVSFLLVCAVAPAADLKLGVIGLDSSHVLRFTELLNDPANPDHVSGATIIAAYKGGSPTVAESADRIERFTSEMTGKWHVALVDSIPELCKRVDAVLLLSVDARQHLEQIRPAFAAKKRVFIDKPLAGNVREAKQIARLSREAGVAFFSASGQRFSKPIVGLQNDPTIGRVEGAFTFGPMPVESYIPDLFWYGVHSVESLYALMGAGCDRVSRSHVDGEDSVVGIWKDGRIGEIRGLRSSPRTYGAVVFGNKRVAVSRNLISDAPARPSSAASGYRGLVEQIVHFFQTGEPPVRPEVTLEILAFMEAADISKQRNGAPVRLAEVLGKADD